MQGLSQGTVFLPKHVIEIKNDLLKDGQKYFVLIDEEGTIMKIVKYTGAI